MSNVIEWLASRGVVTVVLLLMGLLTLVAYLALFTVVTLAVFVGDKAPDVPGGTAAAYATLVGGPIFAVTLLAALNSKWKEKLSARDES